jgi:choline dehydrogenase
MANDAQVDSCDYLVIGAGSGGCAAAARLAALSDARILLLEAGGTNQREDVTDPARWADLLETDANWGYQTIPQEGTDGRVHTWSMGKLLGGSSSVNGMLYMRGAPWDYDGWAAMGNPGWESDAVYEVFSEIENYPAGKEEDRRGHEGPLRVERIDEDHPVTAAFLAACAECGYERSPDFNGDEPEGYETNQVNAWKGVRQDAYTAFVAPLDDRPNLRVERDTTVSELVFEGDRVVAVVAATPAGPRRIAIEGEVLLAAGAIGTPRLLLLAGVGPVAELRAIGVEPRLDLPVGRNLQDHVGAPVAYEASGPFPPSAHQIVEAGLYFRSDDEVPHYDMQVPLQLFPFSRPGFEAFAFEDGYTLYAGLLKPRSRGRLMLRSADPSEPLLIDPAYLTDHDDVQRLVAGVRATREIGAAAAFAGLRKREASPGPDLQNAVELEAYVRAAAGTYFHPVGTCRMGSDEEAVVDPQLKVRGTANVRVVDSSVMPDLPSGNTNLPSMMIGWRAASFALAE